MATDDLVEITKEDLEKLDHDTLVALYKKFELHDKAVSFAKGDIYLENSHEGQIKFHRAPNRIRFFFGGNRSGKTTAGVNECRWRAQGNHPFQTVDAPNKGCIVLQDFTTHAKDIIIPKIKEWFPPDAIKKMDHNQQRIPVKFYLKNGSVMDIKSHDQDIKVFEGSDYDWVWFDEPPPEAIFKALWRGLTDRGGVAFFTGTPLVEPWMYDRHKKAVAENHKGRYWTIFVDIHDNAKNLGGGDEKLGRQRIEEFLEELDPDEREAREKGKFLHMSGLIFKNWDRGIHLINPFPWPHKWPIRISVDPHPRKPWAVSFIGETPSGNQILLSSYQIDDVVEGVAQHILEAKDEIKLDRDDSKPFILECWIDNYASVESMLKKSNGKKATILDELNFHCQPAIPRFVPAPKNVEDKITIYKDWLKPKKSKYGDRPKFLAFDNEENTRGDGCFLWEMEHYVWAKQRGARRRQYKNVPEKENDDILDTIMQICLVIGSEKGHHDRHAKPEVHSYLRSHAVGSK